MLLQILQDDSAWIAVAKPSGQLVIPGRGISGTPLRQEVETYLNQKTYVVHRLDREASGIVLFAKNPEAHRDLCAAFETRSVQKRYLAIVDGSIVQDGSVDQPIRTFGSGRMGTSPKGKPSLTRYHVREKFSDSTFLEVEPASGRRHQIRVHLYSIGHPILGDRLYGDTRTAQKASRLMLHAAGLVFQLSGRKVELCCNPPEDFIEALNEWQHPS
jgi:RluA family pseudouridine synthase